MSWFKNFFTKTPPVPKQRAIEPVIPLATVTLPPRDPDEESLLGMDQVLRKQFMEDIVAQNGVPVNIHLPCIASEAHITVRSVAEVADRLLALTIVAVKGEGIEQEHVLEFVEKRNVRPLLTPKELAFIDDPEPSEHDRIQFVWRYESAWVLLWSLNFMEGPLSFPSAICDVPKLVEMVRDTDDLKINGLHSPNNILNEADLIYRYHWAVRQASLDGLSEPGGLMGSVVMERHHALNWLIGYGDQDWDDVSTDT